MRAEDARAPGPPQRPPQCPRPERIRAASGRHHLRFPCITVFWSCAPLALHLALHLSLQLTLQLTLAHAQPNERLQALRRQDGADRTNSRGKPWDPAVTARDAQRVAAVREELKAGRLRDVKDFYAAALILQHGETPDDFRLANALSWLAYTLADDSDTVPAREAGWLYAASWD